ncbi:MAG: apolipoprotein N-acyltransferase [Candidatus Lindowbacteria bacterium]|nr:apolipoprotein N-acyltransferase [Candidatus Lindowbacteria bacterium]
MKFIVIGILTSLSFPSCDFYIFSIIGPALLFYELKRRPWAGMNIGFLYALGLLTPQIYWVYEYNKLAPLAVILLSAFPYAVVCKVVGESKLRFAVAMTAAEFFRSIGAFALPWVLLGTSVPGRMIETAASIVGVWGISFILYLMAAIAADSVRRADRFALCIVLATLLLMPSRGFAPSPPDPNNEVLVGIVQGNFSLDQDFEFRPQEVEAYLFEATDELIRQGAELIVWSETVILKYLNRDTSIGRAIEAYANRNQVVIVSGAPTLFLDGTKRNSAYIFGSSKKLGIEKHDADHLARYDKYHLVPFGEYVPVLGPDNDHIIMPQGVGDFTPSIMAVRIGKLGLMICYEGAFSYLARQLVNQGAELLITISNDAWATSEIEAEQHYRLTRLRPLETGVFLVRADNVGVSVIMDPRGKEIASLGTNKKGVIIGRVVLNKGDTFFNDSGDWVGWLTLLGLPFYLILWVAKEENKNENIGFI